MISSSSIYKLDDSVMIFVNDERVALEWGGALVGPWGIIIKNNNQTNIVNNKSRIYLSPDIYLFCPGN